MMNGQILLCENIHINSNTGLMSLLNIRNRMVRGAEKFAIYSEFSPERLGRHDVEFVLTKRDSNIQQCLAAFVNGEIMVLQLHMNRKLYRVYDLEVPLHLKDRGFYALDLIVNGMLYATASLECT